MTRVRVLGEVVVVGGSGDVIPLPLGLPRQLVGFLAVHRRTVPRREVLERLWPDVEEESARRRLRTALWEVQRVLTADGTPVVDSARASLSLNPTAVVDLDEAETLLQSGAAEAALRLLEPGLSVELDQEWAVPARRRAEALLLDALEQLVAESADDRVAVRYARRRLELDPLAESAHQDLIRCLARGGDRSAAFAAYARMRDVLQHELGTSPSVESRQLLAQLAGGQTPGERRSAVPEDVTGRRGRVPVPLTALVGRNDELTRIVRLLEESRLVTITGLGGLGKSRLAIAVAETLQHQTPVTFVGLAETRQPETCAYVVAAQLGVVAGPGRAIAEAITELLEGEPRLVVLDNCEHVRDSLADLVAEIMSRCGTTRVLAMSRERLGIPGEQVVALAPLVVPAVDDSDPATLTSPSVRLLIDAAARRGAPPETLQDVAGLRELARRLDGIPLALELAGGRLTTFDAAELTRTLQRGLSVLTTPRVAQRRDASGTQEAAYRHESLVRTFDWSVSTLGADERRLLGLMSTCPGPLPFGLVELFGASSRLGSEPAAALARLVEAGLVSARSQPRWSYSMLEPVRLYAEERLIPADVAVADAALVGWASGFSDEMRNLLHLDELAANIALDHYFPLVRHAVYRARALGDAGGEQRIVTNLEPWATWRERAEVLSWLLDLVTGGRTVNVDPATYRMAASACFRQGRLDQMRDLTDRCVRADGDGLSADRSRLLLAWAEGRWADVGRWAARLAGAESVEGAVCLSLHSGALLHLDELEASIDVARQARACADETGMPTMRALSMLALGRAYERACERTSGGPEPEPVLAEGRRLAASVAAVEIEAYLCTELGRCALWRARAAEAIEPFQSACEHWVLSGNAPNAHHAGRQLVDALGRLGRTDTASALGRLLDEDRLTLRRLRDVMAGAAT